MATISDFLKDSYYAGNIECFDKVVNRWSPLEGLTDHGAVVGMKVLESIAKRIREMEMRWEPEHPVTEAFERFLKKECTKELKALRVRVESYSLPPADNAMTAKDRDERISAYHDMDFCDDFEIYCEYYGLPFHEFGEVYGAKMLRDYVKSLEPSTTSPC